MQILKKLQSEMLDWSARPVIPKVMRSLKRKLIAELKAKQECKLRGEMWMVLQAKLKSRF